MKKASKGTMIGHRNQGAADVPAATAPRGQLGRKRTSSSAVFIALCIIALVVSLPFIWAILTSLKTNDEVLRNPPTWYPHEPTLDAYRVVLRGTNFGLYFRNSAIVATSTTALGLLVGASAAYALARFRFYGRNLLLYFLMVTQMFPSALLLIPLFIMMKNLRLLDTLQGLIVTYSSFVLPLVIWMLRGYYESIPVELEEAALIDGCSRVGAYWRVTLPLASPGLVATAMFSWLLAWGEFMYALIMTNKEQIRTVQVGLAMFVRMEGTHWNELMAASVVASVPIVVLAVFLQKWLVEGLTAGAIKG